MKKILSILTLTSMTVLTGCGGGGGSAGTPSGSGGAVAVSKDPVIKSASLADSQGATTNSIGASGYSVLNIVLTDPSGRPIANQIIDVTGDDQKVIFPEGSSGLTNAAGVASIKVARASLMASGAGSLAVTYSYKVGALLNFPDGSPVPTSDKVIAAYVGYQLSTANLSLVNFDAGAAVLPAYGTRQLSVQANVNGAPALTPVQINFTTTCGQISPTTASTDGTGKVTVSYSATDAAGIAQSTQGCSGKAVEIAASALGSAVATKTILVEGAPATSIGFDSVSPQRIYLADSGGVTQAVVQFKLVNARGESLLGQDVRLTLKTLNGGLPKASIGSIGNTAAVVSTTNGNGMVSVPIFSGTVPTNVIVNAALVNNPAVQTDSAVLAIASGRPAQARASLSIGALAIEGFNTDGTETTVTMSLADRQGNPVPDGTAVNFVTSGGVMIPPTCTTGVVPGDSRCSVKIRSQNPRVAAHQGRVQILAYSAGEEDFVDANFNNVYDCGERWTDLNTAFRDDNESRVFDTGEFSVPRAPAASACASATMPSPTRGDGVWGAADVRMQSTIIFATGGAIIGGDASTTMLNLTIADENVNSMPTGSDVAVEAGSLTANNGGSKCGADGAFNAKIANTLAPSQFNNIPLIGCSAADVIKVTVTSPLGLVTRGTVTVR